MTTTRRSCRAVTRASVLVTALLCVPGCAVAGPGAGEATGTAEEFHAAVAAADGATACGLLAPSVVEELADTAGTPCEEAVLDAGLPEAAGSVRTTVAGREAQVVLGADTVFLTLSGGDWRVTGAGCTPRPERPYDCEISGG